MMGTWGSGRLEAVQVDKPGVVPTTNFLEFKGRLSPEADFFFFASLIVLTVTMHGAGRRQYNISTRYR